MLRHGIGHWVRRLSGLALLWISCAAPAAAGPVLDDEKTADAVLAALKAKDAEALMTLAATQPPDAWLVLDVLFARGEHEPALSFAKAAQRPTVGKIAAYAEARKGKTDDVPLREALMKARKAVQEKRYQDVAPLLAGADQGPACVARVRACFSRSVALDQEKKFGESRAQLERAFEHAGKLGWHEGAALAAFNTGMKCRELRDTEGVLTWFAKASALRMQMEDPRRAGDCYRMVTAYMVQMQDYEQALVFLRKALAIFEKAGLKDRIALMHSDLAVTLGNLGRPREAVAELERAAAVAAEAGDPLRAGEYRANSAAYFCVLEEFERAITTAQGVLALPAEQLLPAARAAALAALAQANVGLGRDGEAQRWSEEAVGLFRAAGDTKGETSLLSRIGRLYHERGDARRGLEYRQRARVLMEKLDEPVNLAITWMNEGSSLLTLGDLSGSLQAFERALDLREALGETPELAMVLVNMANTLQSLGEMSRARTQQRRALEIFRKADAHDLVLSTLINLGDGLLEDGATEEAGRVLDEALALGQRLEDPVRIAQVKGALATLAGQRGDLGRALALAEESVARARATGIEHEVISPLMDVAAVRRKKGDFAGARAAMDECLAIARRHGLRARETTVLQNLAILNLDTDRPAEALAAADAALVLLRTAVSGLSEATSAAGRSEHAHVYASGSEAARRLGRTEDVLRFLELGRASALVEGLRAHEVIAAATVPPELAAEEREARAAEALASNRWRAATAAAKDAKGRAAASAREADWTKARERAQRVGERIQSAARGAADGAYPDPVTLKEVTGLVGADEALLLFQTFRSPAFCLVVQSSGVRVVELGKVQPIGDACARLTRSDRGELDPAAVRDLAALLVAPLQLGAEVRRVLVSPDGALAYVPFVVLVPEREVVYVPSATTLALLSEGRAPPGSKVLAFADPEYGVQTGPSRQGALRSGFELVPLPASREEARAVGDVVVVGREATETRFVKAIGESPRWRAVHVACHGWIDPDRPLLSALALGASDADDGFLTALDVFRLRIPADLVVLSACETGKGRVYAAEGIVGLTRAFMFAGAPRVLVSLWKVDDRATRVLMEAFYARWKKGEPAAAALSHAQRAVREREEEVLDAEASRAHGRDVRARRRVFEDPRFWAGWSLWGLNR